ncbi:MAG: ArsA-related P-loop ATPase [Acidimicrobiia bacterium]
MSAHHSLRDLVDHRHVLVCCGTGGVGKTTTAAALAIEGARHGRRTVVVTIDPAKRLANALGLDGLSNTPQEIDRDRWDPTGNAVDGGRLFALMLDTEGTFDSLIGKYSLSGEQAETILENRFYRNIAGALSGTQEYMAMEKLYELHDSGAFDLIVVDTPPTRHALDFLDAPKRLTRLLDNRVFRMLMVPASTAMRIGGFAATALLKTISRVVGTEVVDDVVAFFRAFEGMEQGFRDRANEVTELLASTDTAFVLVTSPRRDAVEEAEFFAEKLVESQYAVDALIVNRVHPHFTDESPDDLRTRAATVASAALADRLVNLADFEDVARRERTELAGLEARVGDAPATYVPELGRDVHDFAALHAVGAHLAGGG